MKQYIVYMNGNHICPRCSGMMVRFGDNLMFRCLDCKMRYEVIENGQSEKELVLRCMSEVK